GDIQLTRSFNGQLREYQQAGFDWLCFLHENNLSGCLADDMGLGKTVQTLALLNTLKDRRELKTSLLVVPVSALPNWEAEIGKFAPGLTYYRYMGVKRNSDDGEWKKHDLLITSYATLRIDIELFGKFTFDYIVLDESQNIKNFTSRVSKAAKRLAGKHRLALSGTPLENNSMEMWSLFDFLMPGYLGTNNWFKQHWAVPVERDGDVGKAKLLKKMVYPFMLRRKKEEVEKELPSKTEIVERLRMEEEQLHIYAETARLYRDEVARSIEERGLAGASIKVLEGMLRLRQICLAPQLVGEKFQGVSSIKFNHFKELLEDILSEGHKVLVFSQFVKVLGMIR
ncbi:MAG: DEAD/DEAH box helicase family protein, partial [bacterium]|nr:DEAD/DEAH box helicase family protein [bacterium]